MSVKENCKKACEGKNIVFSLLGATGSPATNFKNPATFMMGNLLTALNMLEGARQSNVEEYMYTSTYGVYSNKGEMKENKMWENNPSENDKFAGWAKRMGELQVEAYKKQYNWNKIYIVRPANIYGANDKFDNRSHVLPATIMKVVNKQNPIEVWGDGKDIRDFIHIDDFVDGFDIALKKAQHLEIVNIGSDKEIKIIDLVKTIIKLMNFECEIKSGKLREGSTLRRCPDISKMRSLGFNPNIDLEESLPSIIEWYSKNQK